MHLIACRQIAKEQFLLLSGYQPEPTLLYILAGNLELTINGKREQIGSGTLLFFTTNIPFQRRMLTPSVFYHVTFTTEVPNPFPPGRVPVEDNDRLLSTLQYLQQLEDKNGPPALKDAFLADIFHQLEAERLFSPSQSDQTISLVHYFFEKNLHRKITLQEVAETAALSPAGLIYHFKRHVGTTPMEYLTEMRLRRAEALLCRTNDPISTIAFACGFESPYYFSNTFKRRTGLSPRHYRQQRGV